jgi:hypothetical protein
MNLIINHFFIKKKEGMKVHNQRLTTVITSICLDFDSVFAEAGIFCVQPSIDPEIRALEFFSGKINSVLDVY